MKPKAVIFDLDGTIVKTEHLWLQAALALIKKRGIEITTKEEHNLELQLNGLDVLSACQLIKNHFRLPDQLQALYNEKTELAHQLYNSALALIPGFTDFHAHLKQHSIPSAIATNSNVQTLKIINNALKLTNYFGEHIYSFEVVGKPKPQPDLFLHAAQQLNIAPQNCMVIEDSAHGIKAAKAAQMFCVGINSHGDEQQLQEADVIINGYQEMLNSLLF